MTYRYALAAVFILCAALAPPSRAQSYFLFLDGIPGESLDANHVDWIDVSGFTHELTRNFIFGQQSGPPSHGPIVIEKQLDASSPPIVNALNNGIHIDAATLESTTESAQTRNVTYQIELQNVIVTSYSISGFSDTGPGTEMIALLYEEITITYWPLNSDGTLGSPVSASWNVVDNTSTSIEMVDVAAEVDGSDVLFTWHTNSEAGYYGFEVQHLEDGAYRRAAYVPTAGWSSEDLEYEVRIRGLEPGIHTFRVASLALGGGAAYSREFILSVGVPDGLRLALDPPWPNPFDDRLNVSVSTAYDQVARISLFDVLGREVAVAHDGRIGAGSKSHFTIDPPRHLPSGTYFVRIQTDRDAATRKVVVR